MTPINFESAGWTITAFALFASAVIIVLRKLKLLDRARAKFGHIWYIRELVDCNFCLGFTIIVIGWSLVNLAYWEFWPRGYLFAFCAAPVVDVLTTFLFLFNANYRDQSRDQD